jgi:hypothetical protein
MNKQKCGLGSMFNAIELLMGMSEYLKEDNVGMINGRNEMFVGFAICINGKVVIGICGAPFRYNGNRLTTLAKIFDCLVG